MKGDTSLAALNSRDLKVERYRAKGNGGQNVNKRQTAIRITHTPTGIVAQSQDERNQGQNYKLALSELERRVDSFYNGAKQRERNILRQDALNTGRIRTYNFVTNTVTDHRTGKQVKNLTDILDGKLELIMN